MLRYVLLCEENNRLVVLFRATTCFTFTSSSLQIKKDHIQNEWVLTHIQPLALGKDKDLAISFRP